MTFGLRTWGAGAQLELDTSTFTYQVLHSSVIDFGKAATPAVVTVSVPGFNPATCCATLLPLNLPAPSLWEGHRNAMPYVAVASGSVTVRKRHPNETSVNNDTALAVRLLVMRYA